MRITILGCGTSVGAPMIGMQKKPQFKNPKNHRMRASILIEPFGRPGPAILVDTAPDLRMQALAYFPQMKPRLDAIFITHSHADHLHGLDDIRPFNFYQLQPIPLYAEPQVIKDIENRFPYIFTPMYEGGGKPRLDLCPITEERFSFARCADKRLQKLEAIPLPLTHGSQTSLGIRLGNIAYMTDCSYISDEVIAKLGGLEVLVLDCLRPNPHSTHLHVDLAIDYAKRIGARKTVFTHMGHELEYEAFRKSLPRGMVPAFDGMVLQASL